MALYFCSECVENWKKNKIMDCGLCRSHLQVGWKISSLDNIYGTKKDALDFLGLKMDIVPPHADRPPIQNLEYNNIHMLNLPRLKNILVTPFHLLERNIVKLINDQQSIIINCQKKENKEQYATFVANEFRVLNLFNLVTTYQTKNYCWRAMDPLIQHLITNARELIELRQ